MLNKKAFRVCALVVAGVMASHTAAQASCGTASWYHEGKQTANGERYNPDGISAAHRTLPFGTRVLVTHKGSGRTVVVRINDRGPFIRGRIIDLSRGAKRVIGMGGLAPVCLTILSRGNGKYVSSGQVGKSRKSRTAERRRTREVYGTTQTSARHDANAVKRHRAAEKRAARKLAARKNARAAREARSYQPRKAARIDRNLGYDRMAAWSDSTRHKLF